MRRYQRTVLFIFKLIFGFILSLAPLLATNLAAQTEHICLMPPHPLKEDRESFLYMDGVSQKYGMTPHTQTEGAKSLHPVVGTLKVLGIRVEFQEEIPDDPLTTGNGLMNLTGDPPERYWRDAEEEAKPYPHDREYFERSMKALRNYYLKISNAQLELECTVAPFADTISYRLDQPRAYYGQFGGSSEADIGPGLVHFFHDSIVLADQDSSYLMSDYDAFVVFHSGPGREVDINGDSPGDLWSAHIPVSDLRQIIAGDDPTYQGIPVDDGAGFVQRGVIAPESNTTDGYYLGIQGALFHEFGHELGLPDLYDTSGSSIGVASWALMGSGGHNDNDYHPSEMCVWSKYFLGWIEPQTITENGDYVIQAIEDEASFIPQAYKIPINSHEYFLIENRQYAVENVGSCDNCPPANPDEDNYWLGLVNEGTSDTLQFYSEKSTIIWSSNYDFFLEGEGLLIWHIDDDIIESNVYTNTVNFNVPKGVDLEEADGINDDLDPSFLYAAYYGSQYDPFFDGNNSEFTPFTLPSTHANNGSDTHISILQISKNDQQMSFRVEFDWTQPGFPLEFGEPIGTNSLNHGDINGDGQEEIVAVSSAGNLYAFRNDGSPAGDGQVLIALPSSSHASPSLFDLDNDGDLEILTTASDGKIYAWHGEPDQADDRQVSGFPLEGTGSLSSPVAWDVYQDGDRYVYAASSDGRLYSWRISTNLFIDPSLAPGFPIFCDQGLVGDPLLVDLTGDNKIEAIVVASASGKLFAFDPDGSPLDGFPVNIGHPIDSGVIAGDIDRNTWKELIVATEDGFVYAFWHNGQVLEGFPRQIQGEVHATPALADMNRDGYLDIIVANGNYHISVIGSNGILMNEWPNEFTQYTGHPVEPLTASPIIADIDDDDSPEILLATWDQNIHAWHSDGSEVDRFPLALGGDGSATPMIFDMDDDPYLELVAASEDGYFYAWEMPSQTDYAPWPQYRQNSSLNGQISNDHLLPIVGAEGILIKESVYVYPNPAKNTNPKFRYRIGQPAGVWVHIYNSAGDLIEKIWGSELPYIDNEIEWDISDAASGVYFVKLFAQSGTKKEWKDLKFAITK
ncbi:MAG: hypothetical protein B6244_02325 [Candidatus Cloacimonetes bacterium 4572_55]|nr:MAG: hypothetical protein B6244_02325 [Candidatus Cloacimonetes bacterium 4572_55]